MAPEIFSAAENPDSRDVPRSDLGAVRPGFSDLDVDVMQKLKHDDDGLVAAVVQQYDSGEVLMLGWMDDEALHRTLTTGRVTYFSRSRREYWRKGDTSGSVQWVKGVSLDCDGDALLVRVDQVGAACHTGAPTCFTGRDLEALTGHDPVQSEADEQVGQE